MSHPPLLTAEERTARLVTLPQWTLNTQQTSISRTLDCASFPKAIHLVQDIAALAENANHHPDILVQYNRLTLTLSTHDAGGITEKDMQMAEEIEQTILAGV